MAKTFVFLCLLCAGIVSSSAASSVHHTTISGRIIAYGNLPLCFNGNAYWSMIIHVQNPKYLRAEFIRVDFSLPCGESPKWSSAKPSVQKFRLIRDKDRDAVLEEFMTFIDLTTGKENKEGPPVPNWTHLPGMEQEKLPFGQVVPSYQSVDLPLMPIF